MQEGKNNQKSCQYRYSLGQEEDDKVSNEKLITPNLSKTNYPKPS